MFFPLYVEVMQFVGLFYGGKIGRKSTTKVYQEIFRKSINLVLKQLKFYHIFILGMAHRTSNGEVSVHLSIQRFTAKLALGCNYTVRFISPILLY